jgi:hypothetical protein
MKFKFKTMLTNHFNLIVRMWSIYEARPCRLTTTLRRRRRNSSHSWPFRVFVSGFGLSLTKLVLLLPTAASLLLLCCNNACGICWQTRIKWRCFKLVISWSLVPLLWITKTLSVWVSFQRRVAKSSSGEHAMMVRACYKASCLVWFREVSNFLF